MSEETVALRLPKDEPLVLFGLPGRFAAGESCEVKDRAEETALRNLPALPEGEPAEPFAPVYARTFERAKARLP